MKNLKLFMIAIILLICSFSVSAQWVTDPTINTEVCTAVNKQTEVAICSNGQGGAFMVWRDYRNNPGIFEGDLYAQQLDFRGNPVWTADGIIINSAANGQFRPKIISDGSGGAIIVWAKNGGGFYGYDLYTQRIDADGNLLWNSNGVAVAVSSATDSFHEIIPDGDGGVIITWHRLPTVPGETDIYAQKVDTDGNVLWTTNGVEVCTATGSQSWPKIISDLNGGAIIAWEDGRNGIGTNDIYAQRINQNGIAQWTTDGIPICDDQAYQTMIAICSDGQGGALISWEDNRTGASTIFGQRVNSAGQVQWVANGKILSPLSTTCTKPILNFDNSGSAYLVWETEVQVMETNIGSQKIDLDGNLLWGTAGVDICDASGYQTELSMMNNLAGGIIVGWQDFRNNPEGDIYAQWVDRDGDLKWTINGVAICRAPNVQSYPVLTNDGLAGAIIAWWDLRGGSDEDIYAQNIDYRGILATTNFYYQRNNLNKTITDSTPTLDTLTVLVFEKAANPIIYDITVKIGSVIHDTVSDLDFTLTHNGIFDTLIYRVNGNGGYNFTNTYLNDNLGIPFGGEAAPFTGIFLPYNELSNFTSESVAGEWILTITDHKSGDDGILQDWGLVISESSIVGVEEENSIVPKSIYLYQNYPNPFNPSTTIRFEIPVSGLVTLKIYDVLGNEVVTLVNEELTAGVHETNFDATRFSSGVYFYQIKSGNFIQTKKMILIK
ncbi:MAG: T9SS type A sorting domain-containing protein [Ignavibacteriaceae bacterium]|nr:T9SS type A sorting domain-containing protein [Ignavibacteriaceae bacterium]